jgi:putative inorganic carbon (hco3(-)) transporter
LNARLSIARPAAAPLSAAAVGLAIALVAGLAWTGSGEPSTPDLAWLAGAGLAIIVSLGYLAWQVNPAYIFATAVVLSPLAGNWQALGIPGALGLDRLLLVVAVSVVVLRELLSERGTRLRLEPVHWVLAAAIIYVTGSALAAGTLTDTDSFFRWLQIYGLLPFLAFLTAPLVFRHRRDREILLIAFVGLGAYLGLTALFETVGLDALVFPKYILDPNYGTHFGRARGPFVEAVTNGTGLYVCAVAAAIAFTSWQRPGKRVLAAGVGGLCLLGTLLTLQRSVWLATLLATIIAMLSIRELRRLMIPSLAVGAIAILAALAFVPGLAGHSQERLGDQRTVQDRENANRAAINMIESRPLLGFGWGEFNEQGVDYFQLSPDFPLSITVVHNLFLGLAAELGLVGLTLWVVGFLLGVGTAMVARPPPELRAWRTGLVAIGVFYLVVSNFVPPVVFPNLIVWLWAGVVWAGRVPPPKAEQAAAPASLGVAQARP